MSEQAVKLEELQEALSLSIEQKASVEALMKTQTELVHQLEES